MNKQKMQLHCNQKSLYRTKQTIQKQRHVTKDKNQRNDNKHNLGHLSTSVSDLLKVLYNTRSGNKILKHSTHALKIAKSNNTHINTIKQSKKIFNRQLTSTYYLYL